MSENIPAVWRGVFLIFLSGQKKEYCAMLCLSSERVDNMKFIRVFVFALFFAPFAAGAASNDFMAAAQLLAAAKSADIQQVQALVNNGANVNFVDSTGLSIVCTALMNNDVRAAQILQMYGADASQCDRQIRQYNNRNRPKDTGGLFSGLSSAQTISLAAAGAAVVVGGLLLLTDVFDPGNDNDSTSSGGTRPGGGNGENQPTAEPYLTVPYSPAYLGTDGKVTSSDEIFLANLAGWNPDAGGLRQADFNFFRPTVQTDNNFITDGVMVPVQNYLLMMHGYSAFANEYMGQEIFRDTNNRSPVLVANDAGGGRPVVVGLITKNGLNPTGSAARGDGIEYANSASVSAETYLLDKYLNYEAPENGVLGDEVATTAFDLSGAGTAMNPFASAYDSALGKIVAGWDASGDRVLGDFFGFVPNGRLGVFRTGGGKEWVDVENPTDGAVVGTVTGATNDAIVSGDKITLDGVTYDVVSALVDAGVVRPTITVNGTVYDVANPTNMMRGTCSGDACTDVSDIAIYVGSDGYYYVNTTGGNNADAVYVVKDGNLYAQKQLVDADYKNFEALFNARSTDVLANVSVIEPSRSTSYLTVRDMPAALALSNMTAAATYVDLINSVYDKNNSDVVSQGMYANNMFGAYSSKAPIMVMPAGEFKYGAGDGLSLNALDATFENYAPVIYGENLDHMFMTVVAVQHATDSKGNGGTSGADSIQDYGNGLASGFGPLYLSAWRDKDGADYMSRKCGIAGVGINGIDPWCFAAAGATSEMATASAAGAVASVKAAFDYMTNPQVFMLLALTSDGYLLGTDASGTAFNNETLAAYLQSMYSLPPEYYAASLSADEYLKAFAEVYGYGLINLDRAMTPNKRIYFFDGTNIVSANGNAYWRAATNTVFRPSGVLNVRGASIRAPFYDVVESVDGSMTMPRVWNNEFTMGVDGKRGLYMGDVLGELRTNTEHVHKTQIGHLGFAMSMSDSVYDDNMNGLDTLSVDYASGNWAFGAGYQRYLTDGMSRFAQTHNPVLGLMSNAVVADATYNMGNWSFGARAVSGAITDEGLLEYDPAISDNYMPAKLGLMQGASTQMAWNGKRVGVQATLGVAHETDTLLGAQTDGLLSMGNGDTTYVDVVARWNLTDGVGVVGRATWAQTHSNPHGNFILGMSNIYSNALSVSANIGAFELSVAQPLAIYDGDLQYAYAEYDVADMGNGRYELNVVDTHVADLDLSAGRREVRFTGTYRHSFGEFTDGAIGFIYRVNPNNTDEFGNESVWMMKLTHRLGI